MPPRSLLPPLWSGALLNAPPRSCATESDFRAALGTVSNPASQRPPRAEALEPSPIVILGAGSIIHDGHGPAYRKAGFPIAAIYDRNPEQALKAQQAFPIERVMGSLEAALAFGRAKQAIFDIALPPDTILPIVSVLPEGSGVLIQKPLGKNLGQARAIAAICKQRGLIAGINFQLPFSPQIVGAFTAYSLGMIGTLREARVDLDVRTEWERWPFVLAEPRVEVLLHSIHYLSLFAFYFGPPRSLKSTQRGNPAHPQLRDKDVRSDTSLSYVTGAQPLLARVSSNHLSTKPASEWLCDLVLQGDAGVIRATIGDVLDYPNGPDKLRIESNRFGSQEVPLVGNRFPEAFIATMSEIQQAVASERRAGHATPLNGPLNGPRNGIEFGTLVMAMAEACYLSGAAGGRELELPSA